MMARKKKEQLMLVRADNGDWSLHPPATATKEGEELITLMSGTACYVDERWDRPNQRDYEYAVGMWAHHLSRSMRGAKP
jgi:hypothetical protein